MTEMTVRSGEFDMVLNLSEKEYEVFLRLGAGERAVDIARDLGKSVKTVETQVQKIKDKVGIDGLSYLRTFATRYVVFMDSQSIHRIPVKNPKFFEFTKKAAA